MHLELAPFKRMYRLSIDPKIVGESPQIGLCLLAKSADEYLRAV